MKLNIVVIDQKYCDYLRQFDKKVPYNMGKKANRPFVGVLFTVNNCKYFAPLSSPKPKHLKLKSKVDIMKINNGKLGAVNFNNMIPVTDKNIVIIDLKAKAKSIEELKYLKLLNAQLYWLKRFEKKLEIMTKDLYDKYFDGTLKESIKARCCDFKLLEKKCEEYNNTIVVN